MPRQDDVTVMVCKGWTYGVTVNVPVMLNPWIAQ